jgi:hypothetical protein
MIFSIASMRIKAVLPHGALQRSRHFLAVKRDYGSSPGRGYDFELIVEKRRIPIADITFSPGSIPRIMNPHADTTIIYQEQSMCRISWKQKKAVVSFVEQLDRLEGLFFEYLRMLFTFLLVEKGGLPLHSSAVAKKKKGLVFYGPSGAGKSTIADLLKPSWKLLNDDMNFIMPCRGHFNVHSTPFVRPDKYDGLSKGSARLCGIFLLRKHATNGVSRMAFGRQVLSLASQTHTPPFTDKFCGKMLENIGRLCSRSPVRELSFKKDRSIAESLSSIVE